MPLNDNRGFVNGRWALEVGSSRAGWIYSWEGGMASTEVVQEKLGTDHLPHKHISGLKYEDISVSCGTSMSKGFFDWLKKSFSNDYERKDGALINANFDLKEMSRLNFSQALCTEIGFPGCDATSKEVSRLNVKISPEQTRYSLQRSPGASIAGSAYPIDSGRVQKKWLPRNFRLTIDGVQGCNRVSNIDALVIKQKVAEVPLGAMREVYREPAAIEYPNLVISVAESASHDFIDWYQSFVIDGRCDEGAEKHGQLEYLAEDLKTVVATVQFKNLGIFKLTPDKSDAGGEGIRRTKIEMYCESMDFDLSGTYA